VRLALFRLDELLELQVVLAAAPQDTVTIVPDPAATPAQLAARERWLGCRWPEEAASPAAAGAEAVAR
jgi:predicted metalloprotease with PDZ domain